MKSKSKTIASSILILITVLKTQKLLFYKNFTKLRENYLYGMYLKLKNSNYYTQKITSF